MPSFIIEIETKAIAGFEYGVNTRLGINQEKANNNLYV